MKISSRSVVDAFIVMDVIKAARQAEAAGRHVIHMEVGQPGASAPLGARNALSRAMSDQALGYTVTLGLPELRRAIAGLYKRWYGLDLDPNRVVVTAGSSGAFLLAFTALFDAGARVGLGEPGYPSYRQILRAMNLEPVGIATRPENRFQPVASELPNDLGGMIVASPANPTGTMLSRNALGALIKACAGRSTAFISDEIYHGIQYGDAAVSALEISDDVYVINSFSKYHCMTGWRIGWMIVPPDHVRTIERLSQNMFICASHASQVAALAALDCGPELQANLDMYRANRELMLAGLNDAGFDNIGPPDGAFYIYADVSRFTDNSREFADRMLADANVAATPGLDFDPKRGAGTMRFSYARSTEDIGEGLRRIKAFMASLG